MKTCIACGMPMNIKAEFAMGDVNKDYCVYCAKPDGSMQSYEEKLESMTNFIVKTQGLDPQVAKKAAAEKLAELPAWQK